MSAEVVSQIENIFHPRSIAVTGVSDKSYRLGNLLFSSFMDMGFKGNLYPVNPREDRVMGRRCYPSLKEIEGPVDLAIISVHPNGVLALVEDCVAKGVRAAVIFSSGFREKGEEGGRAEAEIVQKARSGGVRLLGPNCMVLYCPSTGLSFFPGMPKEIGTIAFLSQSGSLANMLGLFAGGRGLRFSKMISVGNSADLGVNDFLEYLGHDPETRLIVLYLEGLEDGRRFISLTREISLKKPILLWKVGRTAGGRKAAGSHTGSLSGSDEIWEAAIRQSGIIKVENLTELMGFITAFQNPHFPAGNPSWLSISRCSGRRWWKGSSGLRRKCTSRSRSSPLWNTPLRNRRFRGFSVRLREKSSWAFSCECTAPAFRFMPPSRRLPRRFLRFCNIKNIWIHGTGPNPSRRGKG
ncbi:MAG: CoA-binding protein [Deltaproteobacteria bacterium]|nr:CoA-binding protein [Deltaproteobacteria bacterium]